MPKISEKDFDYIAEYVKEEYDRRKRDRKHLDHAIKEIDRQIEMRPDTSHKNRFDGNGRNTGQIDPTKSWMPEIELPLQAEALEVLTSDCRAMIFPDNGPWFAGHAAMTDEYLDRVDFTSMIAGDENEVPTLINQDNADKLIYGLLEHWHRQYDFRGHIDLINAEAISYGVGVGRARVVKKSVVMETARGLVRQDQKIPVLVPRSIKTTYLDDREHVLMHEGYMVGPLQIFTRKMSLDDLKKHVQGNKDPDSDDGGWIAKYVNKLEADDKGFVDMIEAEGDFIIPRKTSGSISLPNTIVTVASGKNANKVVRVRFRKIPYNSTIIFPYHKEKVGSPYATSPLRKGWPLQAAATEMWMQLIMAAQLNAAPPVGYDRNDLWFAEHGGPIIAPFALWGTMENVQVHKIGDVSALLQSYSQALLQYSDVVGVHRARLGAQTVSHTTAYAKNVELQRGATRTVDYVRSTLQGPMTQWLSMEYEMGLKNMQGSNLFYIEQYRGFVDVDKDQMPDSAVFEAHGAGAPADEVARQAEKMRALNEAIQMDQVAIAQGQPPTLNLPAMIQERLRSGGWSDVDPFINKEAGTTNIGTAPPVSLQAIAGIGGA